MKEFVWRFMARICSNPAVASAIIRFAQRKPYLHIGDYMHRWWIIPFTPWLPFSIRVHHIMRPDADPYLHDHPWSWRTIVLRGWYIEESVFGYKHYRRAGSTNARTAETFHRIDEVSHGGVWTLFIMGRRINRWGFMVGNPARKVYYRDYVSENDRGELLAPNAATEVK